MQMKMKMKKILISIIGAALSCSIAVSNASVTVRAKADKEYGSWLSDADQRQTIKEAKIHAIENFFDDQGIAATENLEAIEKQLDRKSVV